MASLKATLLPRLISPSNPHTAFCNFDQFYIRLYLLYLLWWLLNRWVIKVSFWVSLFSHFVKNWDNFFSFLLIPLFHLKTTPSTCVGSVAACVLVPPPVDQPSVLLPAQLCNIEKGFCLLFCTVYSVQGKGGLRQIKRGVPCSPMKSYIRVQICHWVFYCPLHKVVENREAPSSSSPPSTWSSTTSNNMTPCQVHLSWLNAN